MAAALRLDCEVCDEEQAGYNTTQIESWICDVKRRPRTLFCSGDMAVLHDGTLLDTLRTPVLATRSPAQMATRTRQHVFRSYGAIQFEDTLLGQRALQLGSLPARSRC